MEDYEICLCNKVLRSTLDKLIKNKGLTQLKDIHSESKAGTTCGGCNSEIEELIVLLNKNKNAEW